MTKASADRAPHRSTGDTSKTDERLSVGAAPVGSPDVRDVATAARPAAHTASGTASGTAAGTSAGPSAGPSAGIAENVRVELEVLARVISALADAAPQEAQTLAAEYNAQLISLRDQIKEARGEDLPPLIEDMERLQGLLNRRLANRSAGPGVDPANPYFGRLVLDEGTRVREILIGRATLIDVRRGLRIVDWRHAPVSRLYFSAAEGDEFDEVFGDRETHGTVRLKRSLTIRRGLLHRVASESDVFERQGDVWRARPRPGGELKGGQGAALRPDTLAPVSGLGVGADSPSEDRRLSEVTGLMSPEQFRVIARPDDQVVTIQGGAGSGKTTVGLHRLAYLSFQNPKRFAPDKLLVLVSSRALQRYIELVLPALGVVGTRIEVFEDWLFHQASRLVPGRKVERSQHGYADVEMAKSSAAALIALREYTGELVARLESALASAAVRSCDEAWAASAGQPLVQRLEDLTETLAGARGVAPSASQVLGRTIKAVVAEIDKPYRVLGHVLGDSTRMRRALATTGVAGTKLETLPGRLAADGSRLLREFAARDEAQGGAYEMEPLALSSADAALLVWVGRALSASEKLQALAHIFADEAQDLTAVELALVVSASGSPPSVTFAGDRAQRQRFVSGDDAVPDEGWEKTLSAAGIGVRSIAALKISYRATAPVARLATSILGDLDRYHDRESLREGVPISHLIFDEFGEAVAHLGQALRLLMQAEPHATVAVITRHPADAERLYAALVRCEVARMRYISDEEFSFKPGIDVVDVAQVRGLEFDYVIVADADASRYDTEAESRHLLHIAVTRAIHQLWLVSGPAPTPLIDPALVQVERL